MKQSAKFYLLAAILFVACCNQLSAQTGTSALWQEISEPQAGTALNAVQRSTARRENIPTAYRTLAMQKAAMQSLLARAPKETAQNLNSGGVEISLPLPEGGLGRFRALESPIMEDALAAKYPDIKTYVVQGIDDPSASGRIDMTVRGLRATVLCQKGRFFIDPYWSNSDAASITYYKKDFSAADKLKELTCGVAGSEATPVATGNRAATASRPTGANLRTYRLALACTGEYAVAVAGASPTKSAVLAAMVTSINRVTAVYEREFAIRLVLVANTDALIYLNASTDPYTNSNGSTMLGQNQTTVDSVIGNANYDIGHVFSTGGGGIAGLGVVCLTGQKANGVTGSPSPVGDPYDIDYVAHEMGHQFGGNHTFNGTSGSASGNRNGATAYEPGSASTIMGYAGICAPQDLQSNSDDYFHSGNYTEIDNYTSTSPGNGVLPANLTSTGNTAPVIGSLPTAVINIPAQTPFALTASATDANGDTLTYCWEEFDVGAAQNPIASPRDNGAAPIFRSYDPTTSPTRYFPSLKYILNNANVPPATYTVGSSSYATGEFLPTTTRTMTFRVSVRDNRAGGGGQNWASMQVKSNSTAGPFQITSPNTATTLAAGTPVTVNWNVASTTASPISCANVKISYSTDGGNTFPVVLAASVPNSGTASVTIPNVGTSATTSGRIKVEAIGNIFFDINDANLSVTATSNPPVITGFSPSSGVQNTTVTITGTDFLSASGVSFNGTTATNFTVNSSTQISAKVPVGASTGTIAVTNPAGTGTSSGSFTVLPGTPAPDVSSFSPAYGIAGTSVTITGTNFSNVLSVTVNGANATSSVNSPTQITATIPNGATSGVIAVNTSTGSGSSANSFTVLSGTGAPTLTSFTPTSGSTLSSVVLTGTNFAGISNVSFNGQTASITTDSVTQITATVPAGATTGTVSVTNPYGTATSSSPFTVSAAPLAIPVVISQIYGGGGNSGATYKNDYVEIYNRDTRVVNLTGWSVQYASNAGTSWTVVPLSGSIQPGKYYLISLASGGTPGATLPPADATSSGLNISAANGKIALLNTTTAVASGTSNPAGTTGLQDFVGYGTANASETSAAPAGSNTQAIFRAGNGATDTDNNSADFSVATPNPRNSSYSVGSAPVVTSATIASGTAGAAIADYQITATNSPTSFNATGLPSGLVINTTTGVISGTPTSAGTSSVTISATNASGTGNATLVFTIAAGGGAPVINSATAISGTVGTAITSYQITATNSPTTFGATGLPANLTMNSAGLISGTPSISGTFPVTISATNASGTGTATLTITIAASGGTGPTALLAGWDFQTTTTGGTAALVAPNTPTSFTANFGSGTLFLNGTNGSSSWITATSGNEVTSFGGTALNAGTGFSTVTTGTSALALVGGTANSANGKSIVFKFSMTGYQGLVVSYATQGTGTGFSSQTWETSTNGSSWTAAQTVTPIPGSYAVQTLTTITSLNGAANAYLRLTFSGATTAAGNNRLDNIQLNATTVSTSPAVSLTGTGTGLSATYGSAGTPSAALTVSGSNLTADIVVNAPAGFEISKTVGGSYASSQTFAQSAGTVANSSLYVRIASGTGAGGVSGNLVATSGTAGSQILLGGTVGKASLTPVFSGNFTPTYDGSPKSISAATTPSTTVTLSYTGTGSTTYDPSSAAPTDAGTYSVTATVSDTNYQGSASQALTIGKAVQTITFAALPPKTAGDPAFNLTATGGGSGQAIIYTSSNTGVAQVFGETVSIGSAGQTDITANQAGNDNYFAATAVTQTLTVNASGPTFASTFPGYAATDPVGGVPALIAYGLGGSTSGTNLGILPVLSYSSGTAQITFLARINDPALTVVAEGSTNLKGAWTAPVTKLTGVSQAGVPAGFERQTWSLTNSGSGFLRARAVLSQ